MIRLAVAALLVLSTPLTVRAESAGFELTAFGAYRMGGQVDGDAVSAEVELDDSASFGALLNWPARDNTEWEILLSTQNTRARVIDVAADLDERVDFDSITAQLGGTYRFGGENVVPYLAMTLGGTHVETRGAVSESDTFFSGSLGLGIKVSPSSRVGLRLEARAYGILVDSDSDIFCLSAPDAEIAGCAVALNGDIAFQVETFAGVTVRF